MDITIKNLQTRIPIRLVRIKRIAEQSLQYLGISGAELSIAFVSPQAMKRLNARHLNHNYVTDILTFDYRAGRSGPLEAEIIICPSVASKNAGEYGGSVYSEIRLYVIHGILHLSGYEDHSPKDIRKIRKKESEIVDYLVRNNHAV